MSLGQLLHAAKNKVGNNRAAKEIAKQENRSDDMVLDSKMIKATYVKNNLPWSEVDHLLFPPSYHHDVDTGDMPEGGATNCLNLLYIAIQFSKEARMNDDLKEKEVE